MTKEKTRKQENEKGRKLCGGLPAVDSNVGRTPRAGFSVVWVCTLGSTQNGVADFECDLNVSKMRPYNVGEGDLVSTGSRKRDERW